MPGFAAPLPDDEDAPQPTSSASSPLRGFGLFRRSSDPRYPPLDASSYARLILRSLVYHRDSGSGDATVLWVPLAHLDALTRALANDGYELDLLSTDHTAAGGVAMGFVHVARMDGGSMHQPMPGV